MSIYYPPTQNAIQKTLDAQLLEGITASMTLNNVVGIANEPGVCVVDFVDTNNLETPTKREYIAFTGVSGNTLTGLTRNADGGGTDQDHAVGAIVQFPSDILQQKAIIDGLLETVDTDGALDTTKVVYLTTAQTLTNKTLTSPLFQGTVDGWISANETWAYASASTITIPAGGAAKYAVGDRIRWKQGAGYKYGVLVTVADTLLTIAVNTDFTVATPTAITDNYYSHQANPIGFPQWFTFNSTIVGFTGTPTQSIKFNILGKRCLIYVSVNGTSNATNFTFTIPVLPNLNFYFPFRASNNGAVGVNPGLLAVAAANPTVVAYLTLIPNVWTDSGDKGINGITFDISFA